MENKRRSIRGNETGLSTVSFRRLNSHLFSGSRIKNISETGICIPLNLFLPTDSHLEVAVNLNVLNYPILTLAKVIRVANLDNNMYRYEAGLEFLELTPAKKNILRDYVRRSLAIESIQYTYS